MNVEMPKHRFISLSLAHYQVNIGRLKTSCFTKYINLGQAPKQNKQKPTVLALRQLCFGVGHRLLHSTKPFASVYFHLLLTSNPLNPKLQMLLLLDARGKTFLNRNFFSFSN